MIYPYPYVKFGITKPLNAFGKNLNRCRNRNPESLATATQTVWVPCAAAPRRPQACPRTNGPTRHPNGGPVRYSTKYTKRPPVQCPRPANSPYEMSYAIGGPANSPCRTDPLDGDID